MSFEPSLLPEDIATLKRIGEDTIVNIVSLCMESVMWTVYVALVIKGGQILLYGTFAIRFHAFSSSITNSRKGRATSRSSALQLVTILAMFALNTTMCIMDFNSAIRELSDTLTSTSSASLADRYMLTYKFPWAAEGALFVLMTNLGDVIIIWRAYVLWSLDLEKGCTRVIILPIAILFGSFVTSALIFFCDAGLAQYFVLDELINPPFCKKVQMASYGMTLATTAVATLLIGYKTWQYQRTVGSHFRPSIGRRSLVKRLMIILLESGALYFFLFFPAVINNVGDVGAMESSNSGLSFARQAWIYVSRHITGIYPILIVIVIDKQPGKNDGECTPSLTGVLNSAQLVRNITSDVNGAGLVSAHDAPEGTQKSGGCELRIYVVCKADFRPNICVTASLQRKGNYAVR